MKTLIEKYEFNDKGYKPVLITSKWQVAPLNWVESQQFEAMNQVEKHTQTDEVFILLEGNAVLISVELDATRIVRHEIQKLVPGMIYNIPANVWHNIAMQEDARIIIVEDANTHLNDVTYSPLNEEQQKELNMILKQINKNQ